MAEIFVSYTSSDREWAFWIATELQKLGHAPRVHEWEIVEDIYAWMQQRHDAAHHVLCVISEDYLKAPYSTLERNAALWQAASARPGFVLLVAVKPTRFPTLSDHMRRCELFGISEDEARLRFATFMAQRSEPSSVAFPGSIVSVSNISVRVPHHFMGRDQALADISAYLNRRRDRVAIVVLHGMRGVGKSTLAAAFAESRRGAYRVTWWVRAQSAPLIQSDLIALGLRLNWISPEESERNGLSITMERLRQEGAGILLILDNAIDKSALASYLPSGGLCHILVTSNGNNWRSLAELIEIRVWPKQIGADYLIGRTGLSGEREAAEKLSTLLDGLPLAHEQAAAYCEHLEVSLVDYHRRFESTPMRFLDDSRHSPLEYHDGATVFRTVELAISEAKALHPDAETLLCMLAILPAAAIPRFVLTNRPEAPSSGFDDERLSEAAAALRKFALVQRTTIRDERNPKSQVDALSLHRLVRQIAVARLEPATIKALKQRLLTQLESHYPAAPADPSSWPMARHLHAIVAEFLGDESLLQLESNHALVSLIRRLLRYRASATDDGHDEVLWQRCFSLEVENCGDDDECLYNTYEHYSSAYIFSNPEQCLELLLKSLELCAKSKGRYSDEYIRILNLVSFTYAMNGKFNDSLPIVEEIFSHYLILDGPHSLRVNSARYNLVSMLSQSGRIEESHAILENDYRDKVSTLGQYALDTISIIPKLYHSYVERMEEIKAESTIKIAIEWLDTIKNPEISALALLSELIGIFKLIGNHHLTINCYRNMEIIEENYYGNLSPELLNGYHRYCEYLLEIGKIGDAQKVCSKVLAISEAHFVEEHSESARAGSLQARCLTAEGKPELALPVAEKALVTQMRLARGRSHQTFEAAEAVAMALDALARYNDAAAVRAAHSVGHPQQA